MILKVTNAVYKGAYTILLTFNNGERKLVNLENSIFEVEWEIFKPLRDVDYFKSFSIHLNTICWQNEADFAPEYLYEIGASEFGIAA